MTKDYKKIIEVILNALDSERRRIDEIRRRLEQDQLIDAQGSIRGQLNATVNAFDWVAQQILNKLKGKSKQGTVRSIYKHGD